MTTRNHTTRRTATALAVVTLVAVLLGSASASSTASASTLAVTASGPASLVRTACTAEPLVVASTAQTGGTTTQVTVQGPDLATRCVGLPLRVALATADGTLLADVHGTVPGAAPVLTVDVPTQDVGAVAVVVGGFVLPATWSVPGPPADRCWVVESDGTPADSPCTVVSSARGTWWGTPDAGFLQYRATFEAPAITVTQHIEFTLTVPAGDPGWWTWDGVGITQSNNAAVFWSRCADLPTVSGLVEANRGPTPEIFLQFQHTVGPSQCQP